MTTLQFAKFQGAGNDFVLLDARPGTRTGALPGVPSNLDPAWPALAQALCDRHFGIGADGLLLAVPPQMNGVRAWMRMLNPDGSESEMCGNGLRCFARWLWERGELPAGRSAIQTGAGRLWVEIAADGQVAAGMGRPRLAPVQIPLAPDLVARFPAHQPVLDLPVALDHAAGAHGGTAIEEVERVTLHCTPVSMGNPHAVVFVDDVDAVPLEQWGPLAEHHLSFPARTNVEFCQVLDPTHMRVRVWERGAGATLACGTGACAAMVAGRLHGYLGPEAAIELPGGTLTVSWPGPERDADGSSEGAEVILSGPAVHVFDGTWALAK